MRKHALGRIGDPLHSKITFPTLGRQMEGGTMGESSRFYVICNII
jgi:hypothetical protein